MKINKQLKVLEASAIQNISIILSTYSLGLEETLQAINTNDEDKLDIEVIQKLKNILSDSKDQAKKFQGKVEDLDDTEKFVVSIVRIPLFGNLSLLIFIVDKRIDAIFFKYNFDAEYSMISNNVSMLKQSYEAISQNSKFQTLIRMILDIGNFLNYKSPKGNWFGFKLQSLKDMAQMKSK